MGCCSSALCTLMWKNYRLKRVRYVSFCCEFLIPVFLVLLIGTLKSLTIIYDVAQGWSDPSEPVCLATGAIGTDLLGVPCPYTYSSYLHNVIPFAEVSTYVSGSTPGHEYAKLFLAGDDKQGLDLFVDYMVNNGTVEGQFVDFADRVFVFGDGSEAELEEYARNPVYGSPFTNSTPEIAAAIVFHKMDFVNAQFDYTLRLNSTFNTFLESTGTDQDPVKIFTRQLFWGANLDYITRGFMALQNAVDTFIIDTMGASTEAAFQAATGNVSDFDRESFLPYGITIVAFPRPGYQIDDFFALIGNLLPLLYILCFLVPISQIVAVIVLEKERRTKEQLKMMGVNESKIVLSWYLTYIVYFALLAVFLTLLGPLQFPKTSEVGAPFSLILFFMFFFQGLSVIAFCFVMSTFFTKSFNSVVGTLCIYLIIYFFYYYATELNEPPQVMLLFPQIAFALTIEVISAFEESAQGVDFNLAMVEQGGFTVQAGLGWLFFDFLFYTALGSYLNVVIPGEFGRVLPWYFPCMPSFWQSLVCGCGTKTENQDESLALVADSKEESPETTIEVSTELRSNKLDSFTGANNIEDVEESLRQQKRNDVGIQIRNLTKVFDTPDGKKIAVDNFNLDVYEGQILVLLGHNGAGKTTTLQMLSGMLTPTRGEVYVYGKKLSTDLAVIRKSLGFCPQHDVLYPELTVKQHLRFYGKLKGLRGEELEAAAIAGIESVGLTEKKNVKSRALSGGMKRKLSLAIALIGDSKVVFVDEPTSGVDPWSRRNMWEIIQNHREGRVIILTTHFMDEADLLGDRIAIMAEGKLKCCGSSLFLKQLYGAGYRLTFVKGQGCDVDGIRSLVAKHVPKYSLVADVGTELSLQLPLASSAKFPAMLRSVDNAVEKNTLGIEQYGISVTTLEEVFIKAGSADDTVGNNYGVDEEAEARKAMGAGELDIATEKKPTNVAWRHFKALFLKRFQYARRDRRACGCNTIVPLMIFTIGLIIIKVIPLGEDDPSYLLGTQDFNPGYSPNAFLPVQEFDQSGSQIDFSSGDVLRPEFVKDFAVENLPITADFDPVRNVFGKTYENGEPTDQECAYVASEGSQVCKHEEENNVTNNAILDTALYVFNETAQAERDGASLFTAVFGQQREVIITDACFQLQGISATQEGFIGLNYATKSCPDDPCLLIEGTFAGLTQCFPAGCLSDLLSNSVLSFIGDDDVSSGLDLFTNGTAALYQCEGNLCNFGPAGLTDPNPCRGSPTSADPTCIADNLVLLDILNVTLDPVRVITEENRDANYCSLRNDTVVEGPRKCLSSSALSTVETLLGLLTGTGTAADVYDEDTGTCVDASRPCEMAILITQNGTSTCSPLTCLGNFTEILQANANPAIAPLIGPIIDLIPTESCTVPVQCTNIVDPGVLALILTNGTATGGGGGARRLFDSSEYIMPVERRRLETTNCTNTTETCAVVEVNSACVDISCTAEAQVTLETAFGPNVGPVLFTALQTLPTRGDDCNFTSCSTTFDLQETLSPVEIALFAQITVDALLDAFENVLNQTGIDPSTIPIDSFFNTSDPSGVEDLLDLIDTLVPIINGPDGIDFIALLDLLGLDTNNVLLQILLQTLQNGGNLNDPTVILTAINSLLDASNTEVTCANPDDECVLSEFPGIPLLGQLCFASGCREDFTFTNASFGDPNLFVCNTTNCNSGCKLPSNCESEELSPVKFNNTFGVLVPAPELCFTETPIRYSYVGMVNNTAIHGSPIVANTVNTAILRFTLDKLGAPFSQANITVRSHPLPLTNNVQTLITGFIGFTSAIFCVFAFAFVPAPMVQYVVLEKQEDRNVKHLQFVSGVSITSYWTTFYIFDLCVYMIPLLGAVVLIFAFEIESFVSNIDAVFVVLLGYGVAVIPFSYALAFFFKKHTSALIWAILINCFTGLILMSTSFALELIETTAEIAPQLKMIWRIFPGFCLGDSLLQLSTIAVFEAFEAFGFDTPQAFDKDITGLNIAYLYLEGLILILLVIGYEKLNTKPGALKQVRRLLETLRILKPLEPKGGQEDEEIDVDVAAEEERVSNGGADDEMLKMKNLRKVYRGGKVAVRNVTLGVPEGQCFGYLGINGAGKTSTLKMITGDIFPTSGSGRLNGFDIVNDQLHVRQHVGYCSQFSALLNRLTVREHLQLFCRIKHASDIDLSVNTLLDRLALRPFANKLAGSLSGGNKRKLSVAIAMIGSPAVLLLDEPSTGMDVVSKRFMWNVIEELVSGKFNGKKTSVVLTTHSMEECEALCSRVAIMVSGRLQCIGSIQHLKSRFGKGFMVELKLHLPEKSTIKEFVEENSIEASVPILLNSEVLESGPSAYLVELCNKLGEPERYKRLMPTAHGNGGPSGTVGANSIKDTVFAEWWLNENSFHVISNFFDENFPGNQLLERHDSKLRYSVPKNETTRLSSLFSVLEDNRQQLDISEYSVSQTTLEQIFNTFASKQEEEQGRARAVDL